jgi:hypothetical protein
MPPLANDSKIGDQRWENGSSAVPLERGVPGNRLTLMLHKGFLKQLAVQPIRNSSRDS